MPTYLAAGLGICGAVRLGVLELTSSKGLSLGPLRK